MMFVPCLSRVEGEASRLGEPLLDEYLRFVAARARPNTVFAQWFDLKVFCTVVTAAPPSGEHSRCARVYQAYRIPTIVMRSGVPVSAALAECGRRCRAGPG
jgi:integrase/recombinase XerD